MSKPLVVISCDYNPYQGKGAVDSIFANEAGLIALRTLIDRVISDGRYEHVPASKASLYRAPFYKNGNWRWLEIRPSTHDDFDCGERPCECGCQNEFTEIAKSFVSQTVSIGNAE